LFKAIVKKSKGYTINFEFIKITSLLDKSQMVKESWITMHFFTNCTNKTLKSIYKLTKYIFNYPKRTVFRSVFVIAHVYCHLLCVGEVVKVAFASD